MCVHNSKPNTDSLAGRAGRDFLDHCLHESNTSTKQKEVPSIKTILNLSFTFTNIQCRTTSMNIMRGNTGVSLCNNVLTTKKNNNLFQLSYHMSIFINVVPLNFIIIVTIVTIFSMLCRIVVIIAPQPHCFHQ